MQKRNVTQSCCIFEHIEIPFIKFIHHFNSMIPNSWGNFNNLFEPFFFLFKLLWINFVVFSMNLFKKII